MSLTAEEKLLVSKSFYQIIPISDRASERFYERLFEIAPQVRDLFRNADMRTQRKKLIDMVALVVYSLDNLEKVQSAMEKLGDRHVGYGVTVAQYEYVGESLFWMLEQELADEYTDEVDKAWRKLYAILTEMVTSHLSTES